ncbi:MAG TPA: M14 family metallopeptidase [Burkholderiales bacterium]|nr:M14 family metallopeptidase [Burkholderiales bacterium]
MSELRFDAYVRYAELTRILHELAAAYPHLLRVESIGDSFEGRDIWLATVTRFSTGADGEKPAMWVDGNIHATELAGSMACLFFLHRLLSYYGKDEDVTRCLDSRAFYICPRLNPDGAELALADIPQLLRSSTRPYPHDDEPIGGLKRQDIDGDGRILTMRVSDPNGPWKICDRDARLMVRREPTEVGGQYFRLLPEGLIENFDRVTIDLQPRKQQLDLNRNFPAGWRQEHEQHGAGPFPASEPEVHAAVQFISTHPNITAGVAFHTYSGVLLRPYSHLADDSLPAEDLWTYQKIGAKGTEITGYPNISVFHDFRYHPKEVITGSLDDWLYDHQGVFAWTVEIWSPQRAAGVQDYKFIEWYREHPLEDDLKLLEWNDRELDGKGFVPWYDYQHPQLGAVQLGGWNGLYTWSNPPQRLLEREIARFPKWLVWQLLISPKLELFGASATRLAHDTWRVEFVVQNTGWLPTYVTKRALSNKLARGVVCEIELAAGATLETGKPREERSELEGRAYKPVTPSSWAGWSADVTDDRAKVEWVVRAALGSTVRLTARHERAGVVRTMVTLD